VLQKSFEDLADNVLAGAVECADAAVSIQAWNGARACIQASVKVREVEELEARLDALEKTWGLNVVAEGRQSGCQASSSRNST
jgi:hypothetical protein